MADGQKISRKSFLSRAISAWTAITSLPALYAIVEYIIPPKILDRAFERLRVAAFGEISLGDAKIVRVSKKAIAVVKGSDGTVRAFSAICTHLGCVVQYQSEKKIFHCNCHGSEFDLAGKNIAGPAPKPLQPYRVELKNDDIIVSQ